MDFFLLIVNFHIGQSNVLSRETLLQIIDAVVIDSTVLTIFYARAKQDNDGDTTAPLEVRDEPTRNKIGQGHIDLNGFIV